MTNPSPNPERSSTERSAVRVYDNDPMTNNPGLTGPNEGVAAPTTTSPTTGTTAAGTGGSKIGVYDAPDRPAAGGMSMGLIIGIIVAILVVAFLLFQFVF